LKADRSTVDCCSNKLSGTGEARSQEGMPDGRGSHPSHIAWQERPPYSAVDPYEVLVMVDIHLD